MDQIGRYRITGEIGRGAMGVVYQALDPTIGRTVAIKTIRLTDLTDPAERAKLHDRLMREARSAGMLSHPGIVTIYDIAEEQGLAYIAMEFVTGSTLDRLLSTSPPSGSAILSILKQTAAALDYAHKRGVVHRDVKPANIMIDESGITKITDFGVARFQSQQMTQAGLMVGTPNYMSPEQIQGLSVDGRSDQFSLAVIAYELLAGAKPFSGDSIPALAYRIVREEPTSIAELNPTLRWPVDTVLRRALAKNPEERFESCSEFTAALENACESSGDWKPLAGGFSLDAATVVEQPAESPVNTAVPERRISATGAGVALPHAPSGDAVAYEGEKDAAIPRPLRWIRRVAAVAFAAALLLAAVAAGMRLLQNSARPEPVETSEAPAAASADPAAPLEALPGESPSSSTEPAPVETAEAPAPGEPDATKAATPKSSPVQTSFITSPSGARVVVDGRSDLSCETPCTLELPTGRHSLAATREGHRQMLRIFNTPQDAEVVVRLDRATGTVMIRSEPPGSDISIDGEPQSEKTPAMLTVPVGRHVIEIAHGGQREQQEVNIREGAITNVMISFDGGR